MSRLLFDFKTELTRSIIEQFGGVISSGGGGYGISSHGQSYGNKWIIHISDDYIEIILRNKLYPNMYDPIIKCNTTIYKLTFNNPNLFEELGKLIGKQNGY